MTRAAMLTCVCAVLAACSSTPQKTAEITLAKAVAAPPQVSPPEVKPIVAAESDSQMIERVSKVLAAKSIYFDYDKYEIKLQYQDALMQDAKLLMSAPKLMVRLEGNADERGSREYNLALGQKRAETVRRALVALGLPDTRLEAVSFGKEKPRATCHEETCWAENRRVDLAVKKPDWAK